MYRGPKAEDNGCRIQQWKAEEFPFRVFLFSNISAVSGPLPGGITKIFGCVGSETLIVLSLLHCFSFPLTRSIGPGSIKRNPSQPPGFQTYCSLHLLSHSIQCLPVTLSVQRPSPLLVGSIVWRAQTGHGIVSASNITKPNCISC